VSPPELLAQKIAWTARHVEVSQRKTPTLPRQTRTLFTGRILFTYAVNNVPPSISLSGNATINEGVHRLGRQPAQQSCCCTKCVR